MPHHYQYEEYVRAPPRRDSPRRDREYSPDRRSAVREESRSVVRDDTRASPRDSFVREVMTLEPPANDARPRSVPPFDTQQMMRRRSPSPDNYYHSRSPSRDRARSHRRDSSSSSSKHRNRSRERSESPLSRARNALEDNFTGSTAGIGASLLGAVAGGWAARQAGEGLARHYQKKDGGRGRRHSDADKDEERIRLASTLIGAAIGGLGANALTNRYEDNRERNRAQPQAWEGRREIEDAQSRYDDERREPSRYGSNRGLPAPEYDETYEDRRRRDDRYNDDRYREESRYSDSRYDEPRRRDDRYDERRHDDRY